MVDESDLQYLVDKMKKGITVKDRQYHLKKYKNCFLGVDAVEWMLSNSVVSNESDAILIGNHLMNNRYIYHVTNDEKFENKKFFYRFSEDDDHGQVLKDESGRKISWSAACKLFPGGSEEGEEAAKNSRSRVRTRTSEAAVEVEDGNTATTSKDGEPVAVSSLMDEIELSPMDKYNVHLLDNVHPASWKNPDSSGNFYAMVIIGAGPGGLVCASSAAGVGAKVALIEEHLFGGDCLNVGCVPSKALIRAADAVAQVREAKRYGVKFSSKPSLDFAAVMKRMRKIRAELSANDSYERFSKGLHVDIYQGRAKFVGKNKIQVKGQILEFHKAVVATGASAVVPPISGLRDVPYLTNANIFNLTDLPPRLCIIGGGPLGCELSQAFARFGSQVHLCEFFGKVLSREDPDAAALVEDAIRHDGVSIFSKTMVVRVETIKRGNKFHAPFQEIMVYAQRGEESFTFVCDALVVSTGRQPNVTRLGLEVAGISFDPKKGIEVNDSLQTSNKNVYAVGDVCSRFQFTHMADFMARTVVKNALFFGRGKVSTLLVPWCTYTKPEVAHVGLYEADMTQQNIEFDTYVTKFAEVDRAALDGDTVGFVKIQTKKGTDVILGATIVNADAGNLISEVTVAMVNKIGLGALANVIHPYPTQAEAIRICGDLYNKTRLTPTVKGLLTRTANRAVP